MEKSWNISLKSTQITSYSSSVIFIDFLAYLWDRGHRVRRLFLLRKLGLKKTESWSSEGGTLLNFRFSHKKKREVGNNWQGDHDNNDAKKTIYFQVFDIPHSHSDDPLWLWFSRIKKSIEWNSSGQEEKDRLEMDNRKSERYDGEREIPRLTVCVNIVG